MFSAYFHLGLKYVYVLTDLRPEVLDVSHDVVDDVLVLDDDEVGVVAHEAQHARHPLHVHLPVRRRHILHARGKELLILHQDGGFKETGNADFAHFACM